MQSKSKRKNEKGNCPQDEDQETNLAKIKLVTRPKTQDITFDSCEPLLLVGDVVPDGTVPDPEAEGVVPDGTDGVGLVVGTLTAFS